MSTHGRLSLTALSLWSVTIAACSSARGPDSDWDGVVRDSAGVEIVLNHGPPLWGVSEPWVLSESLSIGVPDGEPEYMFGRIADMAILSDGRIVIADGMAQHLRFFHPDGRWEMTVGRAGSGPGEFGWRKMDVLVGPGDTLLVVDQHNLRTNKIAPDGTWLDSWPAYEIDDGWMDGEWDHSQSGLMASHRVRYPPAIPDESNRLEYILAVDLAGSPGDTVASVPASATTGGSGGQEVTLLYGGTSTVSLCADNSVLTGRQDRYEIARYGSDARLEQIVRLQRGSVPITGGDQARLLQHFREFYSGGYFSPERVESILSSLHFTETYPAFATLMCGPGGSIWIQPWRPVSSMTEEELPDFPLGSEVYASARFDVFDRQGRYLGVIPFPPGFWPYRFHGEYVLGRWRDALDVEHVKVMKIEGMLPEPAA